MTSSLAAETEDTELRMQNSLFARLKPFLFPILLVIFTVAAYWQVFTADFIEAFDDEDYVTRNPVVLRGLTWYGIKWSMTTFVTGNWHPLTWWSHMADVALFGLNPAGHHGMNLLLHVLNTLILYGVLLRTTGYRGRSFLVASLFALHPLHVESVAWIAERKDLLSTLFGLLAVHSYTLYVRSRRTGPYLAMFVLFCMSLMAKPMLVTLPFLLLVLDRWPLARFGNERVASLLWEKLPLLVPSVVISAVTVVAQQSVGAMVERALPARLFSSLSAYVVYLRKFFLPFDLASFYPFVEVSAAQALPAALFLATISAGAWRYRHRFPWLMTGWLWFLVLLVPVIGVISVGLQAYADRYTYLPAVGVCIIAVWSITFFLEKASFPPPARVASAAVIIAGCALVTWKQTGYWKHGFLLYRHELAVVHGNWHGHFNLGNMLSDRQRYDEAIAQFEAALAGHSASEGSICHNLGLAYERKGDAPRALDYFRKAIRYAPGKDRGYLGVARVMAGAGDLAGAINVLREGRLQVSGSALLPAKEAYLLHRSGRVEDAVKVYRLAIAMAPESVQNYVNLGVLLRQQRKTADLAALVADLRRVDSRAADELADDIGRRQFR